MLSSYALVDPDVSILSSHRLFEGKPRQLCSVRSSIHHEMHLALLDVLQCNDQPVCDESTPAAALSGVTHECGDPP